jgi:hypothetical protein
MLSSVLRPSDPVLCRCCQFVSRRFEGGEGRSEPEAHACDLEGGAISKSQALSLGSSDRCPSAPFLLHSALLCFPAQPPSCLQAMGALGDRPISGAEALTATDFLKDLSRNLRSPQSFEYVAMGGVRPARCPIPSPFASSPMCD